MLFQIPLMPKVRYTGCTCALEAYITYLCLGKVTDPGLGHDGDAGGLHDLADHAGVGRARDAAVLLDIRGDPFQRHHRHCARTLGHPGLNLLESQSNQYIFSKSMRVENETYHVGNRVRLTSTLGIPWLQGHYFNLLPLKHPKLYVNLANLAHFSSR